jgi:DNA-binding protein YbaB
MFNKIKQYRDLRNQTKNLQNQLSQEIIEAQALSGRLKIKMDGNQKVQSVEVDPELLNSEKKKELEDGLKDLYDNAQHELQQVMMQKMRSGNINLPDISNLGL